MGHHVSTILKSSEFFKILIKCSKIFAKIDLAFWQRLFSILQFEDKGFINQGDGINFVSCS